MGEFGARPTSERKKLTTSSHTAPDRPRKVCPPGVDIRAMARAKVPARARNSSHHPEIRVR